MSTTETDAPPVLAPTGEDVRLELPADLRHLTTLRVLAASLGASASMSFNELDDLQIGVDELMTLLVESCDAQGGMAFTFRLADGGLHVLGECPGATAKPEIDDLSERILAAVVDSHASGRGWMSVYKARSET